MKTIITVTIETDQPLAHPISTLQLLSIGIAQQITNAAGITSANEPATITKVSLELEPERIWTMVAYEPETP